MDDADLYGYSLFETLLADRGTFWCLEGHWRRLCAGATYLAMSPPDLQTFTEAILAAHDARQRQVVRVTLRRTGGRWSSKSPRDELQVHVKPYEPPARPEVRLCMAASPLPSKDRLRRYKCGNRLAYQLGYETARAQGFDDCVFLDDAGRLLETAMANIVLYSEGRWVTPPLSIDILPGTMRSYLLRQKAVTAKSLTADDVVAAEAAIVCNAVQGSRPVTALARPDLSIPLAQSWLDSVEPRTYRTYST